MKNIRLPLFGLAVWALGCGIAFCDHLRDATDSVKFYLIEQRYSDADRSARMILTEQPHHIEALYLRIAICQTQILDYESYNSDADRYMGFADSTLSVLTDILPLQKGKDSLDCLFYTASVLGGMGVIKAKNGNWPGAVKCALASAKIFKQVVALDSAYFAAYYGVGVFNYYLSQQLKWMPFFGDKRVIALQQLHTATRAPFPFDFGARNSLCWIHIERNEFAQADTIASSVLSNYPDNTLFIRIKIRIDLARGEYDSVVALAQRLIDRSSKRDPVNWPDMISGYQALVCGYEHLGKSGESLEAVNRALSLPVPDHVRKIPFVKKHLKFIAGKKKKCAARQSARESQVPFVNIRSSSANREALRFADYRDF